MQHTKYGCSSWFPLLEKNLKVEFQKAQNKFIHFCIKWDIFMKSLCLHFADIVQDHRCHWAYLCRKQIEDKKA